MRDSLGRLWGFAPVLVLATLLLTSTLLPSLASAEPALPDGFQDTVAFANLQEPTTFRFAPDHRVFVAEKSGEIKVYDDLGDTTPEVFADLRTEVYDHGDRGLLGLALDPKFDQGRPYVYALYTYDHVLGDPSPAPRWGTPDTSGDSCPDLKGADDCVVSGRLVRLTAVAGSNHALEQGGSLVEEPLAEDWCQQFSSHSIGDLQFGPEGALYASGGDGASFTGADFGQLGTPPNPCGDPPGGAGVELTPPDAEGGSLRAQNLHNLSGKIIRIDPDSGEAWPDNPLVSSPDKDTRRIVAYGFRNPFRFAIDPSTGEIYSGNVGSSEVEEIDRFAAPPKRTYNSGWPCYEGPVRQYLFAPLGLDVCEDLYAAEPGSTEQPFFYFSHQQEVAPGDECSFAYGSAIGGIGFYEGGKYLPKYDGALFFSDPVRGCIYVMFPGADGRPDPLTTTRFLREAQVYPGVDIEEGPDGALYYASLFGDEDFSPGAIHRISYDPGAPTARLGADPQWGKVSTGTPLTVNLSASKSSDPEGDPLQYDWDLDGDGSFETHGGVTKSLTFTKKALEKLEDEEKPLNRVVAVRVSDGDLSSVARVTLYPGDTPPEPEIESPDEDLTWAVGDEIHLAGAALESHGHYLPGLALYWSTRLAHCPNGPENCHKHPLQVLSGLQEGDFVAPEHDYPSYIEITLRAVDARGLAGSETIRIDPRTVDVRVASEPPGLPLSAGLVSRPTPFAVPSIEGANVVLSAPPTAQLNGNTYTWEGWSDGGARIHTVRAEGPSSYTARFSLPRDSIPGAASPGGGSGPPTQAQAILRAHPPKRSHSRTARFELAASPSGADFRCRLDRQAFKPCRSPQVYRHLKPGRHVLVVVAVGADGSRDGAPVAFHWRVLPKRG